MEELIQEQPDEFVNLRLVVPTMKGAIEKTSSFIVFELISTGQKGIQGFLPAVRT